MLMSRDGSVSARNMIFVVEDDPSMLKSVERLLSAHDFEVQGFPSAEDFQERADLSAAACLVLDINLGGISGIELQQQLSRSGHLVPAIFITGKDSKSKRLAALEAGCVAFLTKPFLENALVDAIKKALSLDAA